LPAKVDIFFTSNLLDAIHDDQDLNPIVAICLFDDAHYPVRSAFRYDIAWRSDIFARLYLSNG